MRSDERSLLENAIKALRDIEPDAAQVAASTRRIADCLGVDVMMRDATLDTITSCDDVQQLRAAFVNGSLPQAQTLLIKAHLRDCGACRRAYANTGQAALDWSASRLNQSAALRPRAFGWALVPAFAVLLGVFFAYRSFWQVPPDVRAEVESVDGPAYLISAEGDRRVSPGDKLLQGAELRTGGGSHTVLRLADGSTVEVNERSVLGLSARGKNVTIALNDGALIVQAAYRTSGHLYVKTPDCRVAVTGTVFSVNSGIKGSRVAVLQGAVQVTHAGENTLVKAGDQVSTTDNLTAEPVDEQIAWSHDREKYILLLAQFSTLQHRIEQVPSPALRYSSDLLQRMPANTLLYISIPNFGDFLSQANTIFHDQLQQSSTLQQWWAEGPGKKNADFDAITEMLHQMSGYIGDEIVVAGLKEKTGPGFAVIADVKRSGLDDFLKQQLPVSGSGHPFTVFNEVSLANTSEAGQERGMYALVGEHQVLFSSSISMLKVMHAQLNSGATNFAATGFGRQIESAYQRGAGVILAADLQQMIPTANGSASTVARNNALTADAGMKSLRYLIAEHRELDGTPENHLDVQFSGSRAGIASWLGAPGPMGSLEFVTPNASLVVAALSKDPSEIAQDVMNMVAANQETETDAPKDAVEANLRNDLAASLGGDFLLSLDGPVLPTPAWKAVIEVNDPVRFENTIERMLSTVKSQTGRGKSPAVHIISSEVDAQRFYSVVDETSGATMVQYTFADGYMILSQDRPVLMQALKAYASGDSLAHSAAFKALLPADANANYSAIAYQNLSPVIKPLLAHLSGNLADAVQQIAADARPTAICAWGKDDQIEAASNSHLFGFDFLTLETLIHPGNKIAANNVSE